MTSYDVCWIMTSALLQKSVFVKLTAQINTNLTFDKSVNGKVKINAK